MVRHEFELTHDEIVRLRQLYEAPRNSEQDTKRVARVIGIIGDDYANKYTPVVSFSSSIKIAAILGFFLSLGIVNTLDWRQAPDFFAVVLGFVFFWCVCIAGLWVLLAIASGFVSRHTAASIEADERAVETTRKELGAELQQKLRSRINAKRKYAEGGMKG
jgi:hypothetical protein